MYGTKWVKVSRSATDFVKMCLNKNAQERPFVEDLFEHEFIKKWVDNPVISADTELHISENIMAFRNDSIL